jgi:hypothetical protein
LLEQAWDHRYQKMVRSIRETLQGQGVVCKKEKVDERFGYLEKLINLGAEPSGWLPLLFLNGSSVTTGRRIIVADATPWYCVRAERDPHTLEPRLFYSKAFDFFEIAGSSAIDAGTGHVQSRAIKNDDACDPHRRYEAAYNEAPDIRLSTAAAMSARFPIISPHGAVRNLSNRVVDQVVDGGYFENDGLATALDIAKALKDFDLKPLVIRITNESLSAPPSPAQDAVPSASPPGGRGYPVPQLHHAIHGPLQHAFRPWRGGRPGDLEHRGWKGHSRVRSHRGLRGLAQHGVNTAMQVEDRPVQISGNHEGSLDKLVAFSTRSTVPRCATVPRRERTSTQGRP